MRDLERKNNQEAKEEPKGEWNSSEDQWGFKRSFYFIKNNIDRQISDWQMAKKELLALEPQFKELDSKLREIHRKYDKGDDGNYYYDDRDDIANAMGDIEKCVDPGNPNIYTWLTAKEDVENVKAKEATGEHVHDLIKFRLKEAVDDAFDDEMHEERYGKSKNEGPAFKP